MKPELARSGFIVIDTLHIGSCRMNLIEKIKRCELKLAVIGLGYVGLPLAVEFGKKFVTVGFDVKRTRLDMLRSGVDTTLEISGEELRSAALLSFSDDKDDLRDCDIFIVTVPTPVDKYNQPDLTPLRRASETVGSVMKPGAVVIFESTVYPGCTEEICVPVMEEFSRMKFNTDFFCGYSPERINPGDKEHTFTKIKKIVSGSTPEILDVVDALYQSVLTAGTYRAGSIKVAEAAKVIENSQRDLNVAFVNELAKIFHLIGIDTADVLEAAATKWNFLKFKPGLVGGHCIGVDPYYLTYKAQEIGYLPEVILAGRRINDSMGEYVGQQIVKMMIKAGFRVLDAKVLQLGITFKENCPDIRNSRAVDVTRTLQDFGCKVDIYDPMADPDEVAEIYGLKSFRRIDCGEKYDAVVLAVAHEQFFALDLDVLKNPGAVVFDIKSVLPRDVVNGRL